MFQIWWKLVITFKLRSKTIWLTFCWHSVDITVHDEATANRIAEESWTLLDESAVMDRPRQMSRNWERTSETIFMFRGLTKFSRHQLWQQKTRAKWSPGHITQWNRHAYFPRIQELLASSSKGLYGNVSRRLEAMPFLLPKQQRQLTMDM